MTIVTVERNGDDDSQTARETSQISNISRKHILIVLHVIIMHLDKKRNTMQGTGTTVVQECVVAECNRNRNFFYLLWGLNYT